MAPQSEIVSTSTDVNPGHTAGVCVLVLGMHRSGTSALTRVFSLLGAGLPARLLTSRDGNETGHWESQTLIDYHDHLLSEHQSFWFDWRPFDPFRVSVERRRQICSELSDLIRTEFRGASPVVVKDPRICRFVPLFLKAAGAAGYESRIVIPVRNPLEVAESLADRNGFRKGHSCLLWLRHVLDAEAESRGRPRAILAYEELLKDWRSAIAGLRALLGDVLSDPKEGVKKAIDDFLEGERRHYRHTTEEVLLDPALRHWISGTYGALQCLIADPNDLSALATLDGIRTEFDNAAPYLQWLQDEANELARVEVAKLDEAHHAELDEVTRRFAQQECEAERLESVVRSVEAQRDDLSSRLAELDRSFSSAMAKNAELEVAVERQTDLLSAIYRSTSWRATAPMRASVVAVRRWISFGAARWHGVRLPSIARTFGHYGFAHVVTRGFSVLRQRGAHGLLSHATAAMRYVEGRGEAEMRAGPQQLIDERLAFTVRLGSSRMSAPRTGRGSVVILSDTELAQCIRYRIKHKLEVLSGRGINAEYGQLGDLYRSVNLLQFCHTVIFYRVHMNDLFMIYYDEARRLGLNVVYDVDDPIFARDVHGTNTNLDLLDASIKLGQMRDTVKFRQALALADFLTASTPELAALIESTISEYRGQNRGVRPPVYLWRNVVDREAIELGLEAARNHEGRREHTLTIGYFSGSLAHEADFNVALPALVRVMRRRPHVRLVLSGHVVERDELREFHSRIQRRPFSDYSEYLGGIAECDLVIIPLVEDAFNRYKSCVRMLDAAVVGRPVVVSPVGDYVHVVEHGATGYFAAADEWEEAIGAMLDDNALRDRIAANARDVVLERFSTASCWDSLDPDLSGLLRGCIEASCS